MRREQRESNTETTDQIKKGAGGIFHGSYKVFIDCLNIEATSDLTENIFGIWNVCGFNGHERADIRKIAFK